MHKSVVSGRALASEVSEKLNVTASVPLKVILIGVRPMFPVKGTSRVRVIFSSGRMMVHRTEG